MKKIIMLLLNIFCTLGVDAQITNRVNGIVEEKDGTSIPYANVLLLASTDSSYINGCMTDITGRFNLSFNVQEKIFIKISFIGYKDEIVEVLSGETDLGHIILQKSIEDLSEVIITADRPLITTQNGNLVTIVENTVLSTLGTGEDVLKYIPGVIKLNDELSLIGKGSTVIYVNNHKLMDQKELEMIPANDILSVELIPNPGVKYDAQNRAVLKITTKKRQNKELSIFTLGKIDQGRYLANEEMINLSYVHNGLNFFTNYMHVFFKDKHNEYSTQTNSRYDTIFVQKSYTPNIEQTDYHLITTGINYDLNKKHSLGVRYTHRTSPFKWNALDGFVENYLNNQLYSFLETENHTKAKNIRNTLNSYYQGKLGENGSLKIDVDYMKMSHDANSYVIENEGYNTSIVETLRKKDNQILALKMDFDYNLKTLGTIDFGSEYSFIKTTGDFKNPQEIFRDNHFLNQEKRFAFFLSYVLDVKKVHIEAGLRYENVKAFASEQQLTIVDKRYSDLFPSLSIAYAWNTLQVAINFSKQIRRPSFSDLSNSVSYYNRYSLWFGNPTLEPQRIYDWDLSVKYKFVQFRLNYQYMHDYIIQNMYTSPSSILVTIIKPINIPKYQQIGASAIVEKKVGCWNTQFSAGIYKPFFSSVYQEKTLTFNKSYLNVIFNNTFSLPADFILNIDAECNTGGSVDNMNYKSKGEFNIGIRKLLFNKSLIISLQASDLFKWKNNRTYGEINNIVFVNKSDLDSRRMSFTLTWKFNNYKDNYKGKGAAKNEFRRL